MNAVAAPRVTALLATHNSGPQLRITLRSLQEQTYPNVRAIISDDASTDATPALCRETVATDARFTLIEQSRQLGWIRNINALLKAAKGDLFFFMPHDDELKPTYVEKLVAALNTHPQAALAYSDLDCFNDGRFLETQIYDRLTDEASPVQRGRIWLDQRTSGWCVPYRGLFRAESVSAFHGLRRHLAGEFAADWVWLFRMALIGQFVRVPEVLYRRNRGIHSLSNSWGHRRYNWISAVLACAAEVWRSDLKPHDKYLLTGSVARAGFSALRNKFLY